MSHLNNSNTCEFLYRSFRVNGELFYLIIDTDTFKTIKVEADLIIKTISGLPGQKKVAGLVSNEKTIERLKRFLLLPKIL